MSTSGFYNFRPKVEHPNTMFYQMKSDTEQPPFFFGGSQVPVNLNLSTGSGFKTEHKFSLMDKHAMTPQKRGAVTTINKNDRIMLPKYMMGQK